MAFPAIQIDSATGSDTLSSGAGPGDGITSGSVLNGTTNASTDGAGTTVTLPASTDLSNVLTDGSHAIWFNDTTVGNVNFSRITGKAGSGGATPTVTVGVALGSSITNKTWAIGGKRASIGSTTSYRLFNNGSNTNGDARGGWVIEFASGHTETIAARMDMYGAGDTTNGPIIIRPRTGFAIRPILTCGPFADWIARNPGYWHYDLEFAGGSTSVSNLLYYSTGSNRAQRCKFSPASGVNAVQLQAGSRDKVIDCEISGGAVGITNTGQHSLVQNCYIHGCSSHGYYINTPTSGGFGIGNIISGCGGDGINIAPGRNDGYEVLLFLQNTIYNCAGDGMEFVDGAVGGQHNSMLYVVNNILASNGAYGLRFSASDVQLMQGGLLCLNNQTYNNTTNAYKSSTSAYAYNTCPWASGDMNLDPQFVAAALGNFTIGANLRGKGFPSFPTELIGGVLGALTPSFLDPGAAQRPENTGAIGNNWTGGLRPRGFAPGNAR